MPRIKAKMANFKNRALYMNELRLRKKRQEGREAGNPSEPHPAPDVEYKSEDIMKYTNEDDDDSEGELCIHITEEAGQAIPVEFLPSASGLALVPPQYNISVAPTSVDGQESGYCISINEIQDPLSHEDKPQDDLRSSGDITLRDYSLQSDEYGNVPKRGRGRPKKIDSATNLSNGTKRKRQRQDSDEYDPKKSTVAKKNPPRLVKTMTNAQELMNRKLTDIIKSQNNIFKALTGIPSIVSEGGSKSSSQEDRFEICGKHIASLLRELPTFDALALEAKLMDIVYKEREKLETFRKSLQGYSAIKFPENK